MAKDFNTLGQEQTRYAPSKPTIKPAIRIKAGRLGRERFAYDGKAGPGQRIVTTDNGFALANVQDEKIVTSRKTMEGSRSKTAGASSSAKMEKFVYTNGKLDRIMDRPEPAPIVNPGVKRASSRWSYQCRRLVRPV